MTAGKEIAQVTPINLVKNLTNAEEIIFMMNSTLIGFATNKVTNSVVTNVTEKK